MVPVLLLTIYVVTIVQVATEITNSIFPSPTDDEPDLYFRLHSATSLHESRCPRSCLCGTGTSQPPLAVKGYFAAASCVSRKLTSLPVGFPPAIRIIIARGNALTTASLPASPPPQLTELDLSYNMIADVNISFSIPLNSSTDGSLRHLNLNHNLIEHLLNVSFMSSLSRLEVLLLGYNHIRSLEPGCFEPLVNLRWLSLTGNRLTSLPVNGFSGLGSLTDLTLDHNKLFDVNDWWNQSSSLSPLRSLNLRSLNLANNRIERVSGNAFIHVASTLEYLNLGFNRMRTLPTDALRSAKFRRLRQLTLDGNPVTTLTPRCLERFAVVELRLSHMPSLTAVEHDAMFDVHGVKDIRMHDNPHLVYVDPDMVGRTQILSLEGDTNNKSLAPGNDEVKFLRLHRNRISAMESPLTRHRMPGIELLSLHGNPLSCDCHSDWIREEVNIGQFPNDVCIE